MPPSAESVAYDHALLQEFKGTKYFACLEKYLELMAADVERRLINGDQDPLERLRLYQGMLQGLKMALDIPASVEALYKLGQNGKQ